MGTVTRRPKGIVVVKNVIEISVTFKSLLFCQLLACTVMLCGTTPSAELVERSGDWNVVGNLRFRTEDKDTVVVEGYDQFKTSRLGRIYAEGKFAHNGVNHSDSATYWTLLDR